MAAANRPAGARLWLLLALVLGAAAAALLGRPAVSSAHALLEHADPPENSVVSQSPPELVLYFAQAYVPDSSWVIVRDAKGNDTQVPSTQDPASTKIMHATPPTLAPGVYTIRWQTLSADDGDYAQGSYTLTIANPDGSVPTGASPPAKPAAPQKASHAGSNNDDSAYYIAGAVLLLALIGAAGLWFWPRRQA